MDEEDRGIISLIAVIFFGGIVLQFATLLGVLLILLGGIAFIGMMLVSGENSDFNAAHSDW